MSTVDTYSNLRSFGRPVVTTEDAALRVGATLSATTRQLTRLAGAGLLRKLRHGLWSLDTGLDPLALPEYLSAPFPCYVSFQSALYLHGMISQIPQVIYVASLGPTKKIATSVGDYSLHRISPALFGGFAERAGTGVKVATPAKALVDTLYLSCAKSRLFARLPELELPKNFRVREARHWVAEIPARYRRTMVTRKLDAILRDR